MERKRQEAKTRGTDPAETAAELTQPGGARDARFWAHAEVFGSPGEGARERGMFRAVGPLLVVLPFVGLFLGMALPVQISLWMSALGVALALVTVLLVFIWSSRRLTRFILGARGEEMVARVLARLPEGYEVYHSAWLGRGRRLDMDHVVVGPTGLFLVETKNWEGPIWVEDGQLRRSAGPVYGDPLGQTYQLARSLREALKTEVGIDSRPIPVLCFAGNSLRMEDGVGSVAVDGVACTNAEGLLDVLTAADELGIDDERRVRLGDWLRDQTTS